MSALELTAGDGQAGREGREVDLSARLGGENKHMIDGLLESILLRAIVAHMLKTPFQ